VNRHPRISQFATQAAPAPTQRHRWYRRTCPLGRRRRFANLPGSGGSTSRRRTLTTRSSGTSSGPASSFSFFVPPAGNAMQRPQMSAVEPRPCIDEQRLKWGCWQQHMGQTLRTITSL
jgi:hypothetical protein